MAKKQLTEKQSKVIEKIVAGEDPTTAVEKVYNTKTRASGATILYKLRKNEMFEKELKNKKLWAEEIIQNEGQKLVDILEQIFPKVERARILVEIARTGSIKDKLEALKEINKIEGEYPKEEKEKVDLGGLHIVMLPPKTEPELLKGEVIEPEEAPEIPVVEAEFKEINEGNKEAENKTDSDNQ